MSIRKSAALIVLNSRNGRLLLGRRSVLASFMPDALVFPGGVVDKSDADFPSELCSFAGQKMPKDFAGRLAAVRELFEECGLLPVIQNNNERCVLSASTSRYLSDWQSKLQRKEALFQRLFAENMSQFRLDLTGFYFSNWLTPVDYPKRYDNVFYAMIVDDSPVTCPYKHELREALWYSPTEVMKGAETGIHILPPPQAYEITRIINAQKASKKLQDVADPTKICTQLLSDGNRLIAVLNGDQAYVDGERSTCTPIRDVKEMALWNDKKKPINRMSYNKQPMYSNIKVCISL